MLPFQGVAVIAHVAQGVALYIYTALSGRNSIVYADLTTF